MKALMGILVATAVLCSAPAFAQSAGGADTNMEILKQKMKADKKLLVASNMGLSDEEGKKFWPLYDAYQKELESINQKLGKAISDYAEAYNEGKGLIPDDKAKKLVGEVLAADEQEVNLKKTYAEKVGKVLPGAKMARYLQIENKIRAIIKFELAAQIPLIE
jgi:hypothetical protein